MKIGDRVQLNDTDWQGIVKSILADNTIVVKLDNGIEVRAQENRITLCDNPIKSNTENVIQQKERDEAGRFLHGHKKLGGAKKGKTKSIRQMRNQLLGELEPFLDNMGEIINLIDDPSEKVLAVSRMMKFCVPTYSAVQYSESVPRSLTAEEKLAQLNAKYNNMPEPDFEKDDDDN